MASWRHSNGLMWMASPPESSGGLVSWSGFRFARHDKRIMSLYEEHILPWLIDLAMRNARLAAYRRRSASVLRGLAS
jgi:hypothetical protein